MAKKLQKEKLGKSMLERKLERKKKKKESPKYIPPRRQLPPSYCFTSIQLGLLF
jgi:hypothetical protein